MQLQHSVELLWSTSTPSSLELPDISQTRHLSYHLIPIHRQRLSFKRVSTHGKTYALYRTHSYKGDNMRLSHIGIIVKDIERSIENHKTLFGYKQLSPIVEDPAQKVRVVLIGKSEEDPVKIELISPIGEDSPVNDVLKRRQPIYHLCYEVDNIEEARAEARKRGAVPISQPVEAPLFNERKICFLYTKDHYVIELVETK